MSRARRCMVLAVLCMVCACRSAGSDRQPRAGRPALTAAGGSGVVWRGWRRALLQAQGLAAAGGNGTAAAGETPDKSAADNGPDRCPPLSEGLLRAHAHNGTIMLALANDHQWDFAANWLRHVRAAGIGYAVVAASDAATSRRLAALACPCFEWIDDEIPKLGLVWGEEGWRRMTWAKVFVLDAVADWGFNLVVSDVDVVWFKDPLPLFNRHPHADLMFSQDGVMSLNDPGDDNLEREGGPFFDFNTGVYLMRHNENTTAWAHAWRAFFDACLMHDQHCAYELMRNTTQGIVHPRDDRLQRGWHDRLWVGILPPSMSMSAHSLYLQQLHKVKRVEPYAVHLTWAYNGAAGKRSRMRDMGLWHDPPTYYANGSFVTVDLTLPQGPAEYNEWNENEDMITFFLDTIQAQLQQAYVGLALALAADRAFILPQFQCYCEKIWYGVVRCRVADAQGMPFPVPCPQDYLFDPAKYADEPATHGTPLSIRESSFLDNERTPAEVKDSVLIIQPSAALDCGDCVKESAAQGGVKVLLVPPGLNDTQLLPLLAKYRHYRVWRLNFAGVGATRRAFGGFSDGAAAEALDRRAQHMTTEFCCRREEEAPRYHREDGITVKLSMTKEFRYGTAPVPPEPQPEE